MATYYLNADTGNNTTGTGTSALPWLTIAKAVTSSTTGDTIYCQNSTATYSWVLQDFVSGRTVTGQSAAGVSDPHFAEVSPIGLSLFFMVSSP